ncbi:prepilin-type N-terminal cleavage/methylation domain-containing protein [Candidatus Peregrinibacteria bacterium]|nr:prepilin-type N-terminal cleavage/methylation domain-containing protein [Candidatus Peregrinibacteria bacterium]
MKSFDKLRMTVRAVLGREKGFTLVELLIVIAIIAILTVAFLPGALKAPAKARDAQRQKAVRDIQAAVESYIAEHSGTIPLHGANMCFRSDNIVAGNFSPLPVDPRKDHSTVQVDGSCNIAAQDDKYFYRGEAAFYVVGALMEVRGSGNTCATYAVAGSLAANCQLNGAGAGAGLSDSALAVIDNSDESVDIPDAETPYFIAVGPQNI